MLVPSVAVPRGDTDRPTAVTVGRLLTAGLALAAALGVTLRVAALPLRLALLEVVEVALGQALPLPVALALPLALLLPGALPVGVRVGGALCGATAVATVALAQTLLLPLLEGVRVGEKEALAQVWLAEGEEEEEA